MDINKDIGYLLHHVAFVMGQKSDNALRTGLDIGFSQFKILMCVGQNKAPQQRYIAGQLGQTEASISRQIKIMHGNGLLKTKVSPRNRREHITSLTPKGRKQFELAIKILNQCHRPVLERLSSKQLGQFTGILAVMHNEVCQGDGGCSYN